MDAEAWAGSQALFRYSESGDRVFVMQACLFGTSGGSGTDAEVDIRAESRQIELVYVL